MNLKRRLQQHMHKQEKDIFEQNEHVRSNLKSSYFLYATDNKPRVRQRVRIALSSLACVLIIVIAVIVAPSFTTLWNGRNGNMNLPSNCGSELSKGMLSPQNVNNRNTGDIADTDSGLSPTHDSVSTDSQWFLCYYQDSQWGHNGDDLPLHAECNGYSVDYYYAQSSDITVLYAKCIKQGADTIYIDYRQNGQYNAQSILETALTGK
ncbi:MAG: hypothetical protein PHW00_02070 [Clostridia bacterium]|nr:hypothetical protein [Clostridia bacterium]